MGKGIPFLPVSPLYLDPLSFWHPSFWNFAHLPSKPFVYCNPETSRKGRSHAADTVLKPTLLNKDSNCGKKDIKWVWVYLDYNYIRFETLKDSKKSRIPSPLFLPNLPFLPPAQVTFNYQVRGIIGINLIDLVIMSLDWTLSS